MNPLLPTHPQPSADGIVRQAFAKINLGLEVLRKRPDGYHDIRSVFATISLADDVAIQRDTTIDVVCIPAMTAVPTDNLAYRAAATILAHPSAQGRGAKITLQKRIPAGGGMGGGSSDAAAVLTGIRDLYDLPITPSELHAMALSVGSDVPFFLTGGLALVEGRGETITPLDIQLPYTVLVVFPHIHVDTKAAYSHITPMEREDTATFLKYVDDIATYGNELHNDFELSVFSNHHILQQVKDMLYEKGALYASMSGSGSTMYGLFTNVDNFASDLQDRFPGMATHTCSFVSATSRREQR